MQWFYNLRIAKKLIISFIIVALISGVVGIIGVINIKKMDELNDDMYLRHTSSLPDLANVARSYQRARVELRNMYITKDANKYPEIVNKIHERRQLMDEAMSKFEATIKDDAVREKYNQLKNALGDFEVFLKM